MEFNGVTGYANNLTTNSMDSISTSKVGAEDSVKSLKESAAVVYEPGVEKETSSKTNTRDTVTVGKMQAELEQRTGQLKSIVETMFQKQGMTFANANIFTSDFWKQFSSGASIDEVAVKQAQEDIAEDGYWGINQTSSRILDFAKALSGGDPDKISELESAFEKGYKQATKSWGDQLPSLCSDTYSAVKKGFAQWREEAAASTEKTTE